MVAAEIIRAAAAAALMAGAAAGAGALALAALGLVPQLSGRERLPWCFALGSGLMAVAVFVLGSAGHLRALPLMALMVAFVPGLWLLRGRAPQGQEPPWRAADRLLVAALVVGAVMTAIVAFAPPSDADTLSYHFDLPRQFAEAGRIFILPRAVEGAIPLLTHSAYTAAYVLGGEPALQAWVGLTALALPLFFYAAASRFLPRSWALAGAALLLTTPAVIYGGGSGQVEVRSALFVLAGGLAAGRAVRSRDWRWAAVAGLAAGAYAGTKLFGLFFVAAIGLVLLLRRRGGFSAGLAFGIATLTVALPFYAAVWAATGDPFFPALYPFLGSPHGYWNAEVQAAFETAIVAPERGVPVNPFWLLAYPFKATLDGLPIFESGRTGFGPFLWLALPFALAGAIVGRAGLRRHELVPLALVVGLAYLLWFGLGQSQRVRHLLPLYPLLLLLVLAAAERAVRQVPDWRRPLAAAIGASLVLQLGGQALFTRTFVPVVMGVESRRAFLARTVLMWDVGEWANETLRPGQKLLTPYRGFLYHLNVPFYYCNHGLQALVDCRLDARDEMRFLAQARAQGVTHVLADTVTEEDRPGVPGMARRLVQRGCGRVTRQLTVRIVLSRTLPGLAGYEARYDIVELLPCEARPGP